MKQIRPRQNYLGAGGWVWGGKYKLERYLYILHRVTGLGMVLFLLIHLIETTVFRIQGQDIWECTMELLSKPWFEVGLFLVVAAFVFHGLNGLRLIFQELGYLLGRPIPPIYPYKDSFRKKRLLTGVMMIVIVAIIGVFLFDFLA